MVYAGKVCAISGSWESKEVQYNSTLDTGRSLDKNESLILEKGVEAVALVWCGL